MSLADNNFRRDFPLPTIMVILGQCAVGVWYASQMESRIAGLEKNNTTMSGDLKTLKDNQDGGKDRLIRVEDNVDAIRMILTRLENRFDGDPSIGGMKPVNRMP